jgi:hypothetical protein
LSSPPPPALVTPVAEERLEQDTAQQHKLDYFSAIKVVFQNQSLQRQWLFVDYIVDAINNLAAMPKTSVVKGSYVRKDFLPALQEGLGRKELVGDKATDFESPTRKEFFMLSTRQEIRQSISFTSTRQWP